VSAEWNCYSRTSGAHHGRSYVIQARHDLHLATSSRASRRE
jgi:hypothetical protein